MATNNLEEIGFPGHSGRDVGYAAVHQFGATITAKNAPSLVFRLGDRVVRVKSVTVPARPYLGFSHDDETMLVHVAESYLDHALAGTEPPVP